MLTEDENGWRRRSGVYGLSVIAITLFQKVSLFHQ
jgi:hypothetical protein